MSIPTAKIFFQLLSVAAIANAAAGNGAATAISRDEAISRLSSQLVVRLIGRPPSTSTARSVEARVADEVKKDGTEILPQTIQCPSRAALDEAFGAVVPVEFDDDDYIRARVRLYLYGLLTRLNFYKTFPPMPVEQRQLVASSIDRVIPRIDEIMATQLAPLNIPEITPQSIHEATADFRAKLDKQIGSPFVAAFWCPLKSEDADSLYPDFTERLKDSLPLIQEETRSWPRFSQDDPAAAKRAMSIYSMILHSAGSFIASHTVDNQRAAIDIREFAVPGWQQASNEFSSLMQKRMHEMVDRNRPPTTVPH